MRIIDRFMAVVLLTAGMYMISTYFTGKGGLSSVVAGCLLMLVARGIFRDK